MATASLGCVPGTLIDWAAGVVGIPPAVVRAQINEESGGACGAVSPTGAQGPAQFEPGTWAGLGCGGSPDNASDAMKCYAKYMYQLKQQFHGNVRDALAAYNAGPGNLPAGYGYADTILNNAGQPASLTAAGGTGNSGSGGGGGSGGSSGQLGNSTDPTCAWGLGGGIPGLSSLPVIGSSFSLNVCVIKKTTIRHAVGGFIMVGGAIIALPGVLVLVAFSFRKTGGLDKAADVAAVVPGGQAVAAGLHTAGRRATRTGASASRQRQAARRTDELAERRRSAAARPGRPRTGTPRSRRADSGSYEGKLPA